MYGKVMSIPDAAMLDYFRLVTRFDPGQIARLQSDSRADACTRATSRCSLAREIVSIFHGDEAAGQRRGAFHDRLPAARASARHARVLAQTPTSVVDLAAPPAWRPANARHAG